jgi:hypothetical protein
MGAEKYSTHRIYSRLAVDFSKATPTGVCDAGGALYVNQAATVERAAGKRP